MPDPRVQEVYKQLQKLEGNARNAQIERIAKRAHEAWCGWMKYLFEKSTENEDGTVTIPNWAVDRWKRQMNTPYANLSEEEKGSDRDEANEYLELMKE